ncbi:hypothetical protein SAMN05216387_106144 [Nitrosovibrio tenuis]|uniref:Uncharacterized protein n=1 Tax=Nitrosovibrio tenuis TaxID=1233 RepID=A0A1H7NF16_9PROT|nr:hypothetical protein SAMN05216387_106144 [Nitrosovibrio tenuis]
MLDFQGKSHGFIQPLDLPGHKPRACLYLYMLLVLHRTTCLSVPKLLLALELPVRLKLLPLNSFLHLKLNLSFLHLHGVLALAIPCLSFVLPLLKSLNLNL